MLDGWIDYDRNRNISIAMALMMINLESKCGYLIRLLSASSFACTNTYVCYIPSLLIVRGSVVSRLSGNTTDRCHGNGTESDPC